MRNVKLILILTLVNLQTSFSQDIKVKDLLDNLALGIVQFKNGNYDKSVDTLNELIKKAEKGQAQDLIPEAYLYRAKSNIQLKTDKNVCKDLETALSFNVSDAFPVAKENCPTIITPKMESKWNYDIGSKYFWDKDYINAIPYLSKAIELNPNDKLTLEARALSFSMTDQLDKALVDYNRLIEMDLENSDYYFSRGEIFFELERFEESVSDLDKAISSEPSNIFAVITRGKSNRELKKYNEAIVDFNKVMEEFPSGEIYLERAKSYLGLGDKVSACRDLKEITGDEVTDEVKELLKNCTKQ